MIDYKTVNLFLFPIESEVSQARIKSICNEYASCGYKLFNLKIVDDTNVMLIFAK